MMKGHRGPRNRNVDGGLSWVDEEMSMEARRGVWCRVVDRLEIEVQNLQNDLEESKLREMLWKREAEEANKSLQLLQEVLKKYQGGEAVCEVVTKEMKERVQVVEKKYNARLEHVLNENKKLESVLQCIQAVTMDEDGVHGEGDDETTAIEIDVHPMEEGTVIMEEEDEEEEDVDRHGAAAVSTMEAAELPEKTSPDTTVAQELRLSPTATVDNDIHLEFSSMNISLQDDENAPFTRTEDAKISSVVRKLPLVEFNGDIPAVFTENSMQRILDPPNKHMPLLNINMQSSQDSQQKSRDGSTHWKIPSAWTRSLKLIERKEHPILQPSYPSQRITKNNFMRSDVVRNSPDDAISKVIKELGSSSPAMANVLAQHMTDSLTVKNSITSKNLQDLSQKPNVKKPKKKSLFLQRAPIDLVQVVESSAQKPWKLSAV